MSAAAHNRVASRGPGLLMAHCSAPDYEDRLPTADRQRAVIDVGAEADRPEEGDHAVVDRRGARHVRHMQDSSPRGGRDFHKLQGLLWKCGKLNFCKLRPFRPSDLLRKDLTSPRFPFAPSTERK